MKNKTTYRFEGMPPITTPKNKPPKGKSMWQRAKELGARAMGEAPLGFKPKTGGELNKLKDVRR